MANGLGSFSAALVRVVFSKPTGRIYERGLRAANIPELRAGLFLLDVELDDASAEVRLHTYPAPFGDLERHECIRPEGSVVELCQSVVTRLALPKMAEIVRTVAQTANNRLDDLARDYWTSSDGDKVKKMLEVLEFDFEDVVGARHRIELSIENLDLEEFLSGERIGE